MATDKARVPHKPVPKNDASKSGHKPVGKVDIAKKGSKPAKGMSGSKGKAC